MTRIGSKTQRRRARRERTAQFSQVCTPCWEVAQYSPATQPATIVPHAADVRSTNAATSSRAKHSQSPIIFAAQSLLANLDTVNSAREATKSKGFSSNQWSELESFPEFVLF